MTQDELLQAINKSGVTPDELTMALEYVGALVTRERLKSAMDGVRAAQNEAHQQAEAKLQELQQQIDAITAALAQQA